MTVGAPELLTPGLWAVRLGLGASRPGEPRAVSSRGGVYGDVDFSGAVDILDALEIANVAVGARARLTGDTLEVANIEPANTADGVEATLPDPCRPGRLCTTTAPYTESGPGDVDIVDALVVAEFAVGEARTVLGHAVPVPPALMHLVAGEFYNCGLTGAGQTYCWGDNYYGQLGDGTTGVTRPRPVAVRQPRGLTFGAIAARLFHSCGLDPIGQMHCWGDNDQGGFGDGTATSAPTPVAVHQPAGVTFVEIGAGGSFSCGLTSTGQTYCWGTNTVGELGDGTNAQQQRLPVAVIQPPGVLFSELSTGSAYSCGLTALGQAYCWGLNSMGALGDGTRVTPYKLVAVKQPGHVVFSAIAARGLHTCALTRAGQAYCWGSNEYGQLGDGTTTDRLTPVAVSQHGLKFIEIAVGDHHTCGRNGAGQAYCWGGNFKGQLGDGTMVNHGTPELVHLPVGVILSSIAPGGWHTCGLAVDGRAYCWGYNGNGELGDGTTTQRSTPDVVRF